MKEKIRATRPALSLSVHPANIAGPLRHARTARTLPPWPGQSREREKERERERERDKVKERDKDNETER